MKVTLLGDSIRIGVGNVIAGYGKRAAELLSPDFEVFQPVENCRFAKYTLRMLYDHKNSMKDSRIVHWNNGHWDMCDLWGDGSFSREDEYIENMLRIAKVLRSTHDIVIFATTTPVREGSVQNKNSVIKRYNSLIVPILESEGVLINDLNSLLVSDKNRYIREDLIHLSDEGVEVCAHAVADKIRQAAALLD